MRLFYFVQAYIKERLSFLDIDKWFAKHENSCIIDFIALKMRHMQMMNRKAKILQENTEKSLSMRSGSTSEPEVVPAG